jgi:hypothetical protein
MKNRNYLFYLFWLVSCGIDEQSTYSTITSLSFELDTVMVDPRDEILYLNWDIYQSFISTDRRYLYNFNRSDNSLEKIDLDELRFEKKLPFEKEGPDGIGVNVNTIFPVNSESLFIGKYNGVGGIFSWEGKKGLDLSLKNIGDSSGHLSGNEQLDGIKSFPDNSMVFFGMVTVFDEDEYQLAIIDLVNKNTKRVPLPLMEQIRQFKVTFMDGPSKSSIAPSTYLDLEGDKVILSTGISNALYVSEMKTDSLRHITYQSQLMPIEKSGKYRNEVGSQEEMYAIYRAISEEINYLPPFWDPDRKVFYRFSYLSEYYPNSNRHFLDLTPDKLDVYLTVYDKNLALIAESIVPALNKVPARHFAKDGKIWIFENIEDEMGFVRLSVDF